MSRAKERSTVYVVADSIEQAKEDLRREWGTDRRVGWVIDTGTPVTEPLEAEVSRAVARPVRDALRRNRLVAERDAILPLRRPIPPPRSGPPSCSAADWKPNARTWPRAPVAIATTPSPRRVTSSAAPRATSPGWSATSADRVGHGRNGGPGGANWRSGGPSWPRRGETWLT